MRTVNGHRVLLQAHRGVSTEYPENTLAAFRAACGQGYDLIELDPKFTRDGACVVLHDRTVNRTGRAASGGELTEPRAIAEMTLGEARSLEYGSWKGARFAGEPLPLLGEVFSLARERHMPLKLDNVIESFDAAQTEALFDLAEKANLGGLLGFTCVRPGYLERVAVRFPRAAIHYDGPVDEARLEQIAAGAKGHRLIVWMPFENRLTSWCKTPPLSEERVRLARKLGAQVGAWILEDEGELRQVCEEYRVDVVETTGSLKPDGWKENGK